MKTKIIEATNGPRNWGKFMLGRFDTEWQRRSAVDLGPYALLSRVGWTGDHLLVVDLQTGEGAIFRPGGLAPADLDKHRIWVCPLFEPFLAWLYQQDLTDLDALPDHVDLPDAEFRWSGYRRAGPDDPPAETTTVRGYRVKTTFKDIPPEEVKERRGRVASALARSRDRT